MSLIQIDSHNFLAKLATIKSYLSLLIENKNSVVGENNQKYLEIINNANQDLIDEVKKIATNKLKSTPDF